MLFRFYPALYCIPFLMSALRFDSIGSMGEVARWLIMLYGYRIWSDNRLASSPRRLKFIGWSDVIISGFLFVFFLSTLWSIDGVYTAQRSVSIGLLFSVCFLTFWRYADVYSESYILEMILVWISILLVLSVVLAPVLPGSFIHGRLNGLFDNPNNIGVVAGLAVPLGFSLWLNDHKRLNLFLLIGPLIALLLAGTRSALGGSMVAIMIILIAHFWSRPGRTIFLCCLGVVMLGVLTQTDFFIDRVLRQDSILTATTRSQFWRLAEDYIEYRPFHGHGFGSDNSIHEYYGSSIYSLGLRGYGVMSSYYGMAVQLGWAFTYLFFFWLWLLAVKCAFRVRDSKIVALGATIVSGLIISVFEPVVSSAGNVFSFLFWLCVMFAVRRLQYYKRGFRIRYDGAIYGIAKINTGSRSTYKPTGLSRLKK